MAARSPGLVIGRSRPALLRRPPGPPAPSDGGGPEDVVVSGMRTKGAFFRGGALPTTPGSGNWPQGPGPLSWAVPTGPPAAPYRRGRPGRHEGADASAGRALAQALAGRSV